MYELVYVDGKGALVERGSTPLSAVHNFAELRQRHRDFPIPQCPDEIEVVVVLFQQCSLLIEN